MIAIADAFSDRYELARAHFFAAAAKAGLGWQRFMHPLKGLDGEELSVDVVLDGNADAQKLLIVSSGCHGVEGFCGSGVQIFALHDDEWRAKARAAGVAVLYVHALNPYGFSYLRRVTQENVDLNRNVVDFNQPLPVNAAYDELHPILLPEQWPPTLGNQMALGRLVAEHGVSVLQAIISRGQYHHPDGLFFGGTAPTWSLETWRRILREHAQRAQQMAWIDLHTGLGPNGYGERMYSGRNIAADMARAQRWWGSDPTTPVTVVGDAQSSSAELTGQIHECIYQECPNAQYTGIALEFGTIDSVQVLQALRGDHWLHMHAEKASPELTQQIRQQMRSAFHDDREVWMAQVISQSRQALFQAVDGLATS